MNMNQNRVGGWRDGSPDVEIRRRFNEIINNHKDVEASAIISVMVTDGVPSHLPGVVIEPIDYNERDRKVYDQYPGPGHQY